MTDVHQERAGIRRTIKQWWLRRLRAARVLRRSLVLWWRIYRWVAIGLAALCAYILAVVGFHQRFSDTQVTHTLLDDLYFAYVLFFRHEGGIAGNVPWALQAARFLAPLVVGVAAITAVMAGFARGLDVTRAHLARGHTVVCGLSRKGFAAAVDLAKDGRRVLVIERNQDHALIPLAREKNLVVLVGDATNVDMLALARVDRARRLLAATEDDHANLEIAAAARQLARTGPGMLTCFVHVRDLRLWRRLRELETQWSDPRSFVLECINVYDRAAHAILREYRVDEQVVSGAGPVLIVADGDFGDCLLRGIFDRFHGRTPAPGSGGLVCLLGPRAGEHLAAVEMATGHTGEAVRSVAFDADPATFLDEGAGRPAGLPLPAGVAAAYVCMDDDRDGLAPALAMAERLHGASARVVLCRQGGRGARAVPVGETPGHEGRHELETFDAIEAMAQSGGLFAGLHETLAQRIHEQYRQGTGDSPEGERSADPSLRPWNELREELKDQNRSQAADIVPKLLSIGCDIVPLTLAPPERVRQLTEPEVVQLAREEHERWMRMKRESGWRRGDRFSEARRTHADLKAWDELAPDEQEKDLRAVRAIPGLLADAGYGIVRL